MDNLSIFISSVAQDSLSTIRKSITSDLNSIGHHAVCYEESIQFTQRDAVETCLKYVENSDFLLLFIDSKAGSMISSEGKTVTHLEFLKAHEWGKQILVYVNRIIKDEFFKCLDKLKADHELYVSDFEQFCEKVASCEVTQIQDPYVLAFLYDVYAKDYYLQGMEIGIEVNEQVKKQLSVIMKDGLQYLGLKDEIHQALNHFQTYSDFYENSLKFLEVIQKGEIVNTRLLLSRLRNQMGEVQVLELDTLYQKKSFTSIKPATAITLYQAYTEEMKLLEFDGDVTAENIPAENKESYVVQTAENDEMEEALYYNEDKHLFYFLFKVNSYVFCIHFPTTGEMTSDYALRYQKHVLDAIIKSKGYQYCYFLKKLLGG